MNLLKRTLVGIIVAAFWAPAAFSAIAILPAGATSQQLQVRAVVQSTGAPDTALVYNTSGLSCSYQRPGSALTSITLATQTVTGAYSSGGFVHIGNGWYRLDIPNAAIAAGVPSVLVTCAATGDTFIDGRVDLSPSVNTVQLNGTSQTARDIGASVLLSSGTGTGQISLSSGAVLLQATQTGVTIPNVTTVGTTTNLTNLPTIPANWITAAGIATDAIGAAELATDAGTEIATAAWASATRTLTAGTNIVLAKGTGVTGFNDLSAAQVNSEVDTALVDIHLDHLLAADYDPAAKPGVSTALLNELVESDGGVSRFTANALEQGPSGGGSLTQADLGIHETTIATLASQTSFTLTGGSADDNAYNGWALLSRDQSSSAQVELGCVLDYTGSTRTVTLQADPGIFTIATGDTVILQPAFCTSGVNVAQIEGVDATDQLDAHAAAGLDAAGVRAAVGLAAANLDTQLGGIQSDTDNLQTRVPTSLVSGRMDASVGAYQSGLTPLQPTVAGRTLDVTATGEAGIDWANVGSPTSTVGLSGTTIGTATALTNLPTIPTNWITANGIATDAIGAAELAADAGTELATATWALGTRTLTAGTNIVLAKGTGVTGFNDPTTAAIADAVWDEAIAGHLTAGTTGQSLNAAGGSGDPWVTSLPGSYTSGQAGYILGNMTGGSGLDAAGVRAAIGLASANLDTQLGDLPTNAELATSQAAADDATLAAIAALNNLSAAQVRDLVVEDQGSGVSMGCQNAAALAVLAGRASVSGNTVTYRDPSNGEIRVVVTHDASGNRTAAAVTCPTY